MITTNLSVLKVENGDCVHVTITESGPKLCVIAIQGGNGNERRVWIFERVQNNRNHRAFCYKHEQQFFLKTVEGQKLKLLPRKEIPKEGDLPHGCWFEKVDNGTGALYNLQSVAPVASAATSLPSLSLKEENEQAVLYISTDDQKYVSFKDFKVSGSHSIDHTDVSTDSFSC